MKLPEVKRYLEILEARLEEHLGWGPLKSWKYSDFTELSEQIEEQVGVRISYMTLTRIFQKKEFKRSPQIATLEALAQFLGYQNWDKFCENFQIEPDKQEPIELSSTRLSVPAEESSSTFNKQNNRLASSLSGSRLAVLFLLLILITAGGYLIWRPSESATLELSILQQPSTFPAPIRIKYKVPEKGYQLVIRPLSANSVAKKVKFQLPKPSNRIDLAPEDTIYLLKPRLPMGSYEVLILKGESIVKREPGLNLTRGWEGILQSDTRRAHTPRYRPIIFEPAVNSNGYLGTPNDMKSLVESSWLDKLYWANFFLGKDFGVNANNCQVSLRVRQLALGSMREPALIRITLLTDDGMVEIPITSQNSDNVGEVWVSEHKLLDTDPRLQSFRVEDAYQWQEVDLQLHDQLLSIYLNGTLVEKLPYTKALGKLSCIRIKFQGLGELDDFVVRDGKGKEVYREAFDGKAKEEVL